MRFDSEEWCKARDEKFNAWMLGDRAAIAFALQISKVIGVWDDLIDKDKPMSDTDINNGFITALFTLTGNPFFLRNVDYLRPVMMTVINAWLDANDMQTCETEEDRVLAFYLKDYGIELFLQIAFLVGGYDHMRKVSKDMRAFLRQDTYQQWEHKL